MASRQSNMQILTESDQSLRELDAKIAIGRKGCNIPFEHNYFPYVHWKHEEIFQRNNIAMLPR